MKKFMILGIIALLIMGLATVAFAGGNVQNEQLPGSGNVEKYDKSDGYDRYEGNAYERMWEFCHGKNGMMNGFFNNDGRGMGHRI